jgi:hypothetical protein
MDRPDGADTRPLECGGSSVAWGFIDGSQEVRGGHEEVISRLIGAQEAVW